MATATAKRAGRTRSTTDRVVDWFQQWLTATDEVEVLEERAQELRKRIFGAIERSGKEDDKGSLLLDLTTPVEFKDHEGNVKVFRVLKKERRLTPAAPLPDPEKAEALLRKLKLWLKPAEERAIQALVTSNPYVTITVSVDPEAVAKAYFAKIISEEDYDTILQEQRESWAFQKLAK